MNVLKSLHSFLLLGRQSVSSPIDSLKRISLFPRTQQQRKNDYTEMKNISRKFTHF